MPTSNSNYALELVVGIQDAFTKQSKKIEKESEKLERGFQDLQKTVADIQSFKKAESALEKLTDAEKKHGEALNEAKGTLPKLKDELKKIAQASKQTAAAESKLQEKIEEVRASVIGMAEAGKQNTKTFKKESGELKQLEKTLGGYQAKLQKSVQDEKTIRSQIAHTETEVKQLSAAYKKNGNEVREHERLVQRLGMSLKKAGVNLNDITQEEKQLQAQINHTNQSIKNQEKGLSKLKHFENIGAIAGGAMASAGLAWAGNDKNRNERLLAARANYSLEEVQSASQRQFRNDLIRKYGADQSTVFETQAMAKQQGLSDDETYELTKSAVQLQRIYTNYDPQESIRALGNVSKGFGVSIEEAGNKIYAISRMVGDSNGDLLDTFAEYSSLIGSNMSLDQFSAAIVSARQAGVWNTDKVGDSFKEAYTARFSDQSEFDKLVGNGKTAGTIDAIKDNDLRERLRTAAFKVREDVSKGVQPTDSMTAMLALVQEAQKDNAGAIKPILESMGGTILSEDLGPKVIKAMTEAIQNPSAMFEGAPTLDEAASQLGTSVDKLTNAFSSFTDALTNRAGDWISGGDGVASSASDMMGKVVDTINSNDTAGNVALVGSLAAAGFATKLAAAFATKLGGKLFSKVIGGAFGAEKSAKSAGRFSRFFNKKTNPIDDFAKEATITPKSPMEPIRTKRAKRNIFVPEQVEPVKQMATEAKVTPKAKVAPEVKVTAEPKAKSVTRNIFAPEQVEPVKQMATEAKVTAKPKQGFFKRMLTKTPDPIANFAKEASILPKAIPKSVPNIGGALWRGGKGLMKKVPIIGTALNAASIGMSAMEGDEAQVWKDIGATAGSWLGGLGGGALGLLAGGAGAAPGAVAGSIGGSMAGEELAGWLYDIFNDDKDSKNAVAVAKTEQSIQAVPAAQSAIAPPQIDINLTFTPNVQIDAISSNPEELSQSLVASLRDMTPQLKQALHDAMDDLWKDMDALDQG